MINYQQRRYWKLVLFLLATSISLVSLLYTQVLVRKLLNAQLGMINQLADTYIEINDLVEEGHFEDLTYFWNIVKSNKDIPRILTDTNDVILDFQNLDTSHVAKPEKYLQKQLSIMKRQHPPIEIHYSVNNKQFIYYKNSRLILMLKVYPFLQLLLVIMFILIAYFAFNSSRKYEQNKVWTGMSRETAHQLGTPVSSLMALSETMKALDGQASDEIMLELDKDIRRLELITDRFSKIGTIPSATSMNVYEMVQQSISYLKPRISKKVSLNIDSQSDKDVHAQIIDSLLDWVLENLIKNAVNAMEGEGWINILITSSGHFVNIDVSDSGKGLARNKFKTIFKAGYTTNKRGWGLGLSLSKRIIEMYHRGQIFVKNSEPGKGTTFRIRLKRT